VSDLNSDTAASQLFDFLDRDATGMPADYLPDAPGVMFAGEEFLRAAGHAPKSNGPHGWLREQPGNYRKPVGEHVLQVRQCGNSRSNHWTVERWSLWDDQGIEALVSSGENVPIWARTRQAAMRLAEYCYPIARAPVAGHWEVAR
jgi:hypothetical protein